MTAFQTTIRRFAQHFLVCTFTVFVTCGSTACSNSANCFDDSCDDVKNYLPLDDTEFPYVGIPRIVIETEDRQEIKDRETEVPAKLQIWGEKEPESEIMDLTIRGRGNTSWSTPKKSYKIEFADKQQILGMPKDRNWDLIGNYADKTLMKNYLAYHLSAKLGAYYAPRCEFAELYINNKYLGVYLLTETIKIGKNRVNIPDNDNSYIVEIAENHRENDLVFYTHVFRPDPTGKPFRVHDPKEPSKETLSTLKNHIENFERFLKTVQPGKENNLSQWIDLSECIKHYWVQEFSKNPDATGYSSVYFTWVKDGLIRMGPVWDFDLAFGGHSNEFNNQTDKWLIKSGY
jgi:spore coat protein CotH